MRKMILAMAAAAAIASAAPARATIVDVDARSSAGTTLNLGPGTYTANYIGIANGGAYDAWNAWGQVSGCDNSGENCSTGWLDEVAIDFGGGNVDLYSVGGPGNGIFSTAAQALSVYEAGPLFVDAIPAGFVPTAGIGFTLASAQTVRFFVDDTPLSDNLGVPEPSAWALMIAGFGLAGAALRRRRAAVAA